MTAVVPKKTVKPAKREKSTSTKGHYVKNADLLPAFHEAKALNKLTPKLAEMLMKIAERYSYHPWFVGFSYREDMVAFAIVNLCANWHKFNPEKSSNPFSYYTTACYRSFQAYLGDERKERDGRDKLLIEAGANPSFNYQMRGGKSSDDHAFSGGGGGDHE
jgi:hypothetical protein